MDIKICSKCKESKQFSEFAKRKDAKDGYRNECKICAKEWRLNNKENLLEYNKNWKKSNTEHISIYNKNYAQDNKEKLKNYQKKWYQDNKDNINKRVKMKKITDPIFLISCSVRKRMSEYIKKNNILKTNRTFEIVGLTPTELVNYLESKFLDGMSWENYGLHGWHIDHKIPLSSAKDEEELYKLCHYSNLQPLWSEDNLRKSNKIN